MNVPDLTVEALAKIETLLSKQEFPVIHPILYDFAQKSRDANYIANLGIQFLTRQCGCWRCAKMLRQGQISGLSLYYMSIHCACYPDTDKAVN